MKIKTHWTQVESMVGPGALLATICLTCLLITACGPSAGTGDRPAGKDGWLAGDAQQKFETVADMFGGFDLAMIEVGYRYQVLYWAGEDQNWLFAGYQLEEMEEAMERGFIRRPERRQSADAFMGFALPQLAEAAAAQDQTMFRERFEALRANCIACHVMEDVAFIKVGVPEYRLQPLIWP